MELVPRGDWQHNQMADGVFEKGDAFIAVMGVTGAGKSTFISKCCNAAAKGVGHGLRSMTQEIKWYTFFLNQRKVHLIDTPGFDDTSRSDSDVLRELAFWLGASFSKGFKLTGVIYLHPITANRMSGAAYKNLRTFRKMCGTQSMSSVVLATTMWSDSIDIIFENRETELIKTAEFWGDMIHEGSTTFRHTGDRNSAINIVTHLLNRNSQTILEIQREMVTENKPLEETEAGREVDSIMLKQRDEWRRKLKMMETEMNDAVAAKDQQLVEELAKQQDETEMKIKENERAREELRVTLEKLIQEKEKQHKQAMEDVEKKLSEQRLITEKNMAEFEEYKEWMRVKEAQNAQMNQAREAELEAAKEQVSQGEENQARIAYLALQALKEQEKEAEEEKERIQVEFEVKAQRAKIEEARQEDLQRERDLARQRDDFYRQRQAEYAQGVAMQQQYMQQQYMQQQYVQQQYIQQMSANVGGGALAGGALAGLAIMSGCILM